MNSFYFFDKKQIIGILLFALILTLFLIQIQHVENQGFNPTDDGVIVAQSWRLINGEIPHLDFISIRPIGSGVLHMIHFYSPLPLMISSRWFVLFQFFIISIVATGMFNFFLKKEYDTVLPIGSFMSLLTLTFILTSLNYNMYPWTTIDAIFWTVLSIPLIVLGKRPVYIIIGLIFISFATLSRQNFAIITLVAFLYIFIKNIRNPVRSTLLCLAGAIPFIVYLIVLIKHDAVNLFVEQMTGRTELFETGIIQYGKRLVTGLTAPINFICFVITAMLFFNRNNQLVDIFIKKGFPSIISLIYTFLFIVHIVRHFLLDYADLLGMPFELFFMLVFLSLLNIALVRRLTKLHYFVLVSLFISWTSSISLGDNSPVFSVGIMAISFILLIFDFHYRYPVKLTSLLISKVFHIFLAAVIFAVGIYSQRNVNYRDLGYKQLTGGLNILSEEFGGVRTNPATFAYYNDLKNIFKSYYDSDNIVLVPHNPVFYALMKIRNPASLDWIQQGEYVGQEERIRNNIKSLIDNRHDIIFIIDNIDTRRIHKGISNMNYDSTYIIANLIIESCKEIEVNSDFFKVYVPKKSSP